MYLYQATKDPFLLEVAVEILEAIEHSTKTLCGYATVSSSAFNTALPTIALSPFISQGLNDGHLEI